MDWILPTFQTLGAALGFVTAGIAIWGYFTKGYPIAVIVGAPLGGFGRRSAYLKIVNRSERPLLLFVEGGRPATEFTVWPDHEITSAVYGVTEGTLTTITVDPSGEALLPLIEPSGLGEVDEDSQIIATVRWNFAQPLLLQTPRRLRVSITKRAFNAVVAGVLREASA